MIGNTSLTIHASTFAEYVGTHGCFPSHSRVTNSKLLAARSLPAAFSACLCALGSTFAASSFRASACRLRASASPVSG